MATKEIHSISPAAEKFVIPKQSEYAAEFTRLKQLADQAKKEGKEVVVVLGVGFVGAVMASVVADTVDSQGKPSKFVIGCDLPGPGSYWKIPIINRGEPPVKAEDPEVYEVMKRVVKQKKTLTATFNNDCLKLADVVVVDVQCDFHKKELGNMRTGETDIAALEAAIKTIGEKIQANCLTLIETTVAPGTTELVAWPIMKKAFKKRGIKTIPLLSHSYERVMPGREYVSSIRDFWRVCAGCDQDAKKRIEKFLTEVLNTKEYPLTVLDRPIESETAKIVENSYRASILAFMNEWSLFAERNGVDIVKVYKAIKMRPTHSNIMFPGPGVGGYCLPKDGGLGYWAYEHILGFNDGDDVFKITPSAIDINDTRALHVAELTRDALRNIDIHIAGSDILICGASYRQDVGDTRYSGSELVLRRIKEMGGDVRVHDPYVDNWIELEQQDTFPNSWSKYFRKQEELKELKVSKNLKDALVDAEAMILAVPHEEYMDLNPDDVFEWAGQALAIIDCFGILDDAKIKRYFELGCEVKGLGRGHIQHIKKEVLRK
ncbi:MAG: GDP-mannose dehydrogenase [Bacteroidetes bacterium]|nr:GDP-mannose dehydrogenase [Bacteroidota bacterium]